MIDPTMGKFGGNIELVFSEPVTGLVLELMQDPQAPVRSDLFSLLVPKKSKY